MRKNDARWGKKERRDVSSARPLLSSFFLLFFFSIVLEIAHLLHPKCITSFLSRRRRTCSPSPSAVSLQTANLCCRYYVLYDAGFEKGGDKSVS